MTFTTPFMQFARGICGLLAVVLVTGSASAALGYRTVPELIEVADVVVYGEVSSVEGLTISRERGPRNGPAEVPAIRAQITPFEFFKGEAVQPLFVSAVRGMEDSPRFGEGEQVILFLESSSDGIGFTTVGLLQGKLDVEDGVVVRYDAAITAFLEELRRLAAD